MRACIVTSKGSGSDVGLDQIASLLRDQGWVTVDLSIDVLATEQLDGFHEQIAALFEHTPRPLRDSWTFAGLVRTEMEDCEVVVFSDEGGLGGIFAVESSNRRTERWPQVWTVAGSSRVLRYLRTGRSLATTDEDSESVVDWEIAQYVASDLVICRSDVERELLGSIGVETVGIQVSLGSVEPVSARSNLISAPGPVSRLDASGDVLRAASSFSDVTVVFGETDAVDEYWSGTTWESLAVLRDMMGDRVSRFPDIPKSTDLVVIGDPFADHGAVMQWALDTSTSVAVPTGSVIAQQWSGVTEWSTADELADIIGGVRPEPNDEAFPAFRPQGTASVLVARAQRISVGIPVFGECPFLDELMTSIANQTLEVHEVVIVADGPPSESLEDHIEKWGEVFEDRLKYLEQPNRGVCVARNVILEAATGDAILLVDQDDLLAEHALERLSGALRSNPRQDGVACWTEFFGEYNGIEAKPPFDRRVGIRENPIVSTAVLLDMSVVEAGLTFEPDLAFLYCEDWNFWADMVSSGFTLGLVPEPLVRHRVHSASGGFRRRDLALGVGRDRARRKLQFPTTL